MEARHTLVLLLSQQAAGVPSSNGALAVSYGFRLGRCRKAGSGPESAEGKPLPNYTDPAETRISRRQQFSSNYRQRQGFYLHLPVSQQAAGFTGFLNFCSSLAEHESSRIG
jgi:hypothetical protein